MTGDFNADASFHIPPIPAFLPGRTIREVVTDRRCLTHPRTDPWVIYPGRRPVGTPWSNRLCIDLCILIPQAKRKRPFDSEYVAGCPKCEYCRQCLILFYRAGCLLCSNFDADDEERLRRV